MKNLQLVTAISCSHKSGLHVPMEQHAQYELIYYRYGNGITQISGERHTFSSNTFILIPPYVEHDEQHYADCELIFVRIQTAEKLPTGIFADKQETIYRIVKDIFQETIQQDISYKEMIELKLNELFITIQRLDDTGRTRKQSKNFEYIINYISDNYHSKILFKNLATCAVRFYSHTTKLGTQIQWICSFLGHYKRNLSLSEPDILIVILIDHFDSSKGTASML